MQRQQTKSLVPPPFTPEPKDRTGPEPEHQTLSEQRVHCVGRSGAEATLREMAKLQSPPGKAWPTSASADLFPLNPKTFPEPCREERVDRCLLSPAPRPSIKLRARSFLTHQCHSLGLSALRAANPCAGTHPLKGAGEKRVSGHFFPWHPPNLALTLQKHTESTLSREKTAH